MGGSARRYDQDCCHRRDADSFERCHTGVSEAGPNWGRSASCFDHRPAPPFGLGGGFVDHLQLCARRFIEVTMKRIQDGPIPLLTEHVSCLTHVSHP
jgi:hypothetical protein